MAEGYIRGNARRDDNGLETLVRRILERDQSKMVPVENKSLLEDFTCRHNVIRAHRIYDEEAVSWESECMICKSPGPFYINDNYDYDIDQAIWRSKE